MVKKAIITILACIILLSATISGYASDAPDIKASVYLNGTLLGTDAYILNNTVFLPVRALSQALGYTVKWSEKSNKGIVTVTKPGKSIDLDLNTQTITTNGHTFPMSGSYSGDGCILYKNSAYLAAELFSKNFSLDIQYDPQNKNITIKPLVENSISITTIRLNSEDENLRVTLQYPQIDGLDDIKVQNSINSVIRHAAVSAVEEGLANTYELVKTKEQYSDYTNKCDTYFDYRITYNQKGLLGIVLYNYQYAGGAHGITVQTSYTFDLNNGGILDLSDLMKDASYLSYIDKVIRTEIDKRVASGDLVEFEYSRFETIGDHPGWYLTNDSLVIYFQQYEYFPYAAGIQEIPIKYLQIKDYLKLDIY